MSRTSAITLEAITRMINRAAGSTAPLWRTEGGKNIATVGAFTLDYGCGGWELHLVSNESGAVEVIIHRCPASAMEDQLRAFHKGLTFKRGTK